MSSLGSIVFRARRRGAINGRLFNDRHGHSRDKALHQIVQAQAHRVAQIVAMAAEVIVSLRVGRDEIVLAEIVVSVSGHVDEHVDTLRRLAETSEERQRPLVLLRVEVEERHGYEAELLHFVTDLRQACVDVHRADVFVLLVALPRWAVARYVVRVTDY